MNEMNLPIKSKLNWAYFLSIIIAILTIIISLIGILNPSAIYTSSQRVGNVATDWTNLVIAIPVLLGSMWATYKGHLLGLLLWPSSLLFFVFVYLFYSIAVPFNWVFLPYLILASLSGYTVIGIFTTIEAQTVKKKYTSQIPTKLIGGVLLLFGIGFIMLDIIDIIVAFNQIIPVESDISAPWIVDFTVGVPLILIGGVLIIQKKALGYVFSPSLLLYLGMLDFGVSILYLFKWIYNEPDFEIGALIIFFIVALICFIPLLFFFKNSIRNKNNDL